MANWEDRDEEAEEKGSRPTEVLPSVESDASSESEISDSDESGTVEMDKAELMDRLSQDSQPVENRRKTERVESVGSEVSDVDETLTGGGTTTLPMKTVDEPADDSTHSYRVPEQLIEQSRPTAERDKRFVTLDIPLEKIDDPEAADHDGSSDFPDPATQQVETVNITGFEFEATIDDRGRVRIPSKYFEMGLVEPGMQLVLTAMPTESDDDG